RIVIATTLLINPRKASLAPGRARLTLRGVSDTFRRTPMSPAAASRPPDVSVVIVNFNGGAFTPACLESIPAGTETIVIDNGSKDGSADAIEEKFPSVIVVR